MHSKIYRMRYFVTFHNQTHAAFAELIFDNSAPYAVLAWENPETRDRPLVSFPLDASVLVKSQEDGVDYVYGQQLPGAKPN